MAAYFGSVFAFAGLRIGARALRRIERIGSRRKLDGACSKSPLQITTAIAIATATKKTHTHTNIDRQNSQSWLGL